MFQSDLFAARLKAIRIELCLSQEALAHRLGISRVALSYYENGQRTPDVAFLQALHEVTGYPLEYLMGLSEARKTENIDLSKVTGLNDTALNLVLNNAGKINELTSVNPDDFEDILHLASPLLWKHFYHLIASSSEEECEKALSATTEIKALYFKLTQHLLKGSQCLGYGDLSKEDRELIRKNLAAMRSPGFSPSRGKVLLPDDLNELAGRLNLMPREVESAMLDLEDVDRTCQRDYPYLMM